MGWGKRKRSDRVWSNPYLSLYLVPHYCLKYGIFDSNEPNVLNLILSVDKDLLQTCEFPNVIQCVTRFKANHTKGKYEIEFKNFDRQNAISYIYENFKPGILTAKFIPLILAMSGDKSDDIIGISGVGASKAVRLIEKNSVPYNLDRLKLEISNMPDIIQKNIDCVIRNYKLISFDEQIKRLPKEFLTC